MLSNPSYINQILFVGPINIVLYPLFLKSAESVNIALFR